MLFYNYQWNFYNVLYFFFFVPFQEYFAQVRAPTPMASLPAGMPGFPPMAPRITPTQMYFGPGSPGLLSSQAGGFGFQPHLLPGLHRPSFGPNFLVPYPQIPRQGQRFGARRAGSPQQQVHYIRTFFCSINFLFGQILHIDL